MALHPPRPVKKRTFENVLIAIACIFALVYIIGIGYFASTSTQSMRHYLSSKEKVAERVETYIEELPEIEGVQEWDYAITETMFFTPGTVYLTAEGKPDLNAVGVHAVLTEIHNLRGHAKYEFHYVQDYGQGAIRVNLGKETPKDLTTIPVQTLMDEIDGGASSASVLKSDRNATLCEARYDVRTDDVQAHGPMLLAPAEGCDEIVRQSFFHEQGEEGEQSGRDQYFVLNTELTPEQREALLPVFEDVETVVSGMDEQIEGYDEVTRFRVAFTETHGSFDTLAPDSSRVIAAVEFTKPILQMRDGESRIVEFVIPGNGGTRKWRVLVTDGQVSPLQYEYEDSQVEDLAIQFIELLGS